MLVLIRLIGSISSFKLAAGQVIGFSSTTGGLRVRAAAVPDAGQAEEQVHSSRVGSVGAGQPLFDQLEISVRQSRRATAWPAAPGPANATCRLRLPPESTPRPRRSRPAFREFHRDSRVRSRSRGRSDKRLF